MDFERLINVVCERKSSVVGKKSTKRLCAVERVLKWAVGGSIKKIRCISHSKFLAAPPYSFDNTLFLPTLLLPTNVPNTTSLQHSFLLIAIASSALLLTVRHLYRPLS